MSRIRARVAQAEAGSVRPSAGPERDPRSRAGQPFSAWQPEGRSLEPGTRNDMEASLGHDFSAVRIHADDATGASALALGAAAYSVREHVVFAPGRFRPETSEGRGLLAHELAHVAQGSGASRGAASLDRPGSAAEREADRVSADVAAGRPSRLIAVRHASPVLGRSLLGGLLGGGLGATIGAVGGALLGGLLGPAGAIVGGIVGGLAGLVGGAIVGDVASRRSRHLTSDERAYAREIYHDAVDYDAITITRGSMLATGAARTIGNTINLQPEHFKDDTTELSDAGLLVLIHEMGHVWQYQNGGLSYIPSSLIPQIVAGIRGQSRNVAYDWRGAIRNHIPWESWNAEQQAECISDYNEALRKINASQATLEDYDTVTLAQPFIELVRQRFGAPGSSRRTPAAAAGNTGAAAGSGSTGGGEGAPSSEGSTP